MTVQANLPKAGGFSKAVSSVGKELTDKVTGSVPDISNPKAASGKPTVGKLGKGGNPVKVHFALPSSLHPSSCLPAFMCKFVTQYRVQGNTCCPFT